jgi:UDPglucose--hexose-1-phosphate uridylyltransferase
MSELRQDPITGRWVIIAPQRAARPWHVRSAENEAPSEACPFCAGNETATPSEVWAERDRDTQPNTPGWRVRVVPNKYPALEDCLAANGANDGLYKAQAGLGVHEVIVESPEHIVHMTALGTAELTGVLRAYRARLGALQEDPRWRYLLIYKNQGERAGATLEHVHSQLVALPAVPPEAGDELQGARRHFERAGGCIFCEIIERERKHGERLILESARFIALCPFAPRFAYETWILPKHHGAHFVRSSDEDLAALGEMLRGFLVKLNVVAGPTPFNYLLCSTPPRETVDEFYHWHLKILPQWNRAAGFEWGSGMHMNPLAPEHAARLLRDASS